MERLHSPFVKVATGYVASRFGLKPHANAWLDRTFHFPDRVVSDTGPFAGSIHEFGGRQFACARPSALTDQPLGGWLVAPLSRAFDDDSGRDFWPALEPAIRDDRTRARELNPQPDGSTSALQTAIRCEMSRISRSSYRHPS